MPYPIICKCIQTEAEVSGEFGGCEVVRDHRGPDKVAAVHMPCLECALVLEESSNQIVALGSDCNPKSGMLLPMFSGIAVDGVLPLLELAWPGTKYTEANISKIPVGGGV